MSVRLRGKSGDIVRNRVAEPEDGIGLDVIPYILQHGGQSALRNIALVVTPLAGRVFFLLGFATVRPAAEDLLANVAHAFLVIVIDMEVGDKSYPHCVTVRLDFTIELVDEVVTLSGLRLVFQRISNKLFDIDLLPHVLLTLTRQEGTKLLVVEQLIDDKRPDEVIDLALDETIAVLRSV